MANDLVEKVEEYRCRVCKKLIAGSREKAEDHARVPVPEPLPAGFVYSLYYSNSYIIITSNAPSLSQMSHDLVHNGIRVNRTEYRYYPLGPLFIQTSVGKHTEPIYSRIVRENYEKIEISSEQLEIVRNIYQREFNFGELEKLHVALPKPKDLTNKLD